MDRFFPSVIANFRERIDSRRGQSLFLYLLLLRATPMIPNTSLTLACPLVGVPLWMLLVVTLIGLQPETYMVGHGNDLFSTLSN